MSSDQHVATRKNLSLGTAIFGVSAIGSVIGTVVKLIGTGFGGALLPLAFLIVGLVYFRNGWKAFGEMEYGKANRNTLISTIAGILSALFAFGVL
ncbi:MAG: hypothetical protein MUE85_03785 [Microscillaceae bacterium]|jgi:hypothetical protein|nr:hypothetical protein [Microscillaceae bacterium]